MDFFFLGEGAITYPGLDLLRSPVAIRFVMHCACLLMPTGRANEGMHADGSTELLLGLGTDGLMCHLDQKWMFIC